MPDEQVPVRLDARAIRRLVVQHLEVVGLAVLVLATLALPKSTPFGIYALGAVGGAGIALQALGVVLVYRANRVINFAQIEIGAVGGVVFVELVRRQMFLVGLHYVCPTCVRLRRYELNNAKYSLPVHPAGWLVQGNYWLSMIAAVVVVLVLGFAVHALIIKRFMASPRLILTLVTIGLAQTFVLVEQLLRRAFGDTGLSAQAAPLPFHLTLRVAPVTFGASDLATIVVAGVGMALLVVFLRASTLGIVLRGSAENPTRAQSLGVNVTSVGAAAWVIAALLSVTASLLSATSLGISGQQSTATLVRILAAAVIGGMVSFPLTAVAALVLGMVDQSILWALASPALVDGLLVVVIVGVLLLQRRREGRADTDREGGWRANREMRPIPTELRQLDVVKRWVRNGWVVLAAVVLGLPWVLSPGQTNVASTAFVYGIVGLSLLVLTGWAGQISLGQFGLAAVGAWTVGVTGWPFPLALLAGALLGAAAAVVVGLPALRLRGLHLAVSTLAFAVGVTAVLLEPRYLGRGLPESIRRPVLVGVNFNDERAFYYLLLAFLVLSVVAVVGMRRSRLARALIGCRDNEALAQSYGISLIRIRLSAFAISGFMAAIGGGLLAFSQSGVRTQTFQVGQSINMFLIAVIGGLGSIAGPLIGATYFAAINMFTGNALVALAATGIGVILLLLVMPGGLGEGFHRIRDAVLRRVAERYRIDVPSLTADGKGRVGERAAIAPKQRPGGGKIFVPTRYRLGGQWALDAHLRARRDAARDAAGNAEQEVAVRG